MEIWFNPKCSKCRAAKEMLDDAGADYVVRRYLEDPPSVRELEETLTRLELDPWDITRMNEPVAQELGLATAARDRQWWIQVLADNPVLIQRPIVLTSDGAAWIARSPEAVDKAVAAEQP